MKKILLAFASLLLCFSATAAQPRKAKTQNDYSNIHGVCHTGWRADEARVRRELGYGQRIGLNSTRIWMGPRQWERDPQGFIKTLKDYIGICNSMGYTVMPILFNGNGLDPQMIKEENWPAAEAYIKAVVGAVKGTPGLLCWDIMNEPTCNDYYKHAPEELKEERAAEIFRFVRKACQAVKAAAPDDDITVGVTYPKFIESASPDLVDVISFHDYRETRAIIRENYDIAKAAAEKYGKQMINSEMGCIGRSNPYDIALQIAEEYNAGWYLFELMINNPGWGEIHGIFYEDGTVRDPSIVAACLGFYRNRDLKTMVRENPNREGYADEAIRRIKESFKENKEVFKTTSASTDDILEAAEWAVNILEGAQMLPMHDLLSAKILYWRSQDPKERNTKEIRQFAYQLVDLLEQNCEIFD
ncbi:MAG: glycoside hydrolase family 5 protein [Bacteroidales bacterium]|nr:glycoside hydrolase family 5 protein [Bacteroidales bacterium]